MVRVGVDNIEVGKGRGNSVQERKVGRDGVPAAEPLCEVTD